MKVSQKDRTAHHNRVRRSPEHFAKRRGPESLPQKRAVPAPTGGKADAAAPKPTARPGARGPPSGHLISQCSLQPMSPPGRAVSAAPQQPQREPHIQSPGRPLRPTAPTTPPHRAKTPGSRTTSAGENVRGRGGSAALQVRVRAARKPARCPAPGERGAWPPRPHRIGLGVGKGPAEACDWWRPRVPRFEGPEPRRLHLEKASTRLRLPSLEMDYSV